jgi:hypothetical protein
MIFLYSLSVLASAPTPPSHALREGRRPKKAKKNKRAGKNHEF